jgi:exonuclease VII small subunit
MKRLLLFVLITLTSPSFAYQSVDSLTYMLQKNKINQMLEQRSAKFGEYDQSLSSRTGIFGLKTKRDMQKSIDILADIIFTDNTILKETKTLLDYQTFQKKQVVSQGKDFENRNLEFMRTINKIETQNDKLQTEVSEFKKGKKFYQLIAYALGLAIISFALFVFRKISLK